MPAEHENMKAPERSCAVSMTGDPITVGHRDIIARAANTFGKVYVFLSKSSAKPGHLLDYADKAATVAADLRTDNVRDFEIVPIEGVLVDQVAAMGIRTIVRGLRNEQDLVYETDMSAVNRLLQRGVETVYLPCKPELSYVSSSMVRELVRLGKYAEAEAFTSAGTVRAMKRRLTKVVALTGGIAAGKSETQRVFEEAGWAVLDCDDVNRERVLGDTAAAGEIAAVVSEKYGIDVRSYGMVPGGFGQDGIDRKKLADLVFSNPSARADVQTIAFARIAAAVDEFISDWRVNASMKVAVQVPLLFEQGTEEFSKMFGRTVCVTAPDSIRIARMSRNRGYSGEEIERRMAAQMAQAEKAALCDYVIDNAGTVSDLEDQVRAVIRKLEETKP